MRSGASSSRGRNRLGLTPTGVVGRYFDLRDMDIELAIMEGGADSESGSESGSECS